MRSGPVVGLSLLLFLFVGCADVATRRVEPSRSAILRTVDRERISPYERPAFADPLARAATRGAMEEARLELYGPPLNIYDDIVRPPLIVAGVVTWDTMIVATGTAVAGAAIWAELATACSCRGGLATAGIEMGFAIMEAGLVDLQDVDGFIP